MFQRTIHARPSSKRTLGVFAAVAVTGTLLTGVGVASALPADGIPNGCKASGMKTYTMIKNGKHYPGTSCDRFKNLPAAKKYMKGGGGGGNGGGEKPARTSGKINWDKLAQCESSGNWSINTGNGYYGGLQFSLATWKGFGGKGMPHKASKAEQIRIAERVLDKQGKGAWPGCRDKGMM